MMTVGGCTVFARMPSELARDDRPCPWAAAVLGHEGIGSFLEGPCFTPDGTLYVSDLAHGRILRAGPGGRLEVHLDYGGAPNGMAALPDGSLLIADYERGLLRLGIDRTIAT